MVSLPPGLAHTVGDRHRDMETGRSGERVREFLWDLGASTGRLCAPHAARDLLTRAEHLPGLLHSLLGAAQSEKQRGSLASTLHLCCGPGGWPGREAGGPLVEPDSPGSMPFFWKLPQESPLGTRLSGPNRHLYWESSPPVSASHPKLARRPVSSGSGVWWGWQVVPPLTPWLSPSMWL